MALTHRKLCLHVHLSNTARCKGKLSRHTGRAQPTLRAGLFIWLNYGAHARQQCGSPMRQKLTLSFSNTKDHGRRTKIIMQPFPGPLPSDRHYHTCNTHPFARLLLGLHSSAEKIWHRSIIRGSSACSDAPPPVTVWMKLNNVIAVTCPMSSFTFMRH